MSSKDGKRPTRRKSTHFETNSVLEKAVEEEKRSSRKKTEEKTGPNDESTKPSVVDDTQVKYRKSKSTKDVKAAASVSKRSDGESKSTKEQQEKKESKKKEHEKQPSSSESNAEKENKDAQSETVEEQETPDKSKQENKAESSQEGQKDSKEPKPERKTRTNSERLNVDKLVVEKGKDGKRNSAKLSKRASHQRNNSQQDETRSSTKSTSSDETKPATEPSSEAQSSSTAQESTKKQTSREEQGEQNKTQEEKADKQPASPKEQSTGEQKQETKPPTQTKVVLSIPTSQSESPTSQTTQKQNTDAQRSLQKSDKDSSSDSASSARSASRSLGPGDKSFRSESISPRPVAVTKTGDKVSEIIQRLASSASNNLEPQKDHVSRSSSHGSSSLEKYSRERRSSTSSTSSDTSRSTNTTDDRERRSHSASKSAEQPSSEAMERSSESDRHSSSHAEYFRRSSTFRRHSSSRDVRHHVSSSSSRDDHHSDSYSRRDSGSGLRRDSSGSLGSPSRSLSKRSSAFLAEDARDESKLRDDLRRYRESYEYYKSRYREAEESCNRKRQRIKELEEELRKDKHEMAELIKRNQEFENTLKLMAAELVRVEQKLKQHEPNYPNKSPIVLKAVGANPINLAQVNDILASTAHTITPPVTPTHSSTTPFVASKSSDKLDEKKDKKKKELPTVDLATLRRPYKPALAKKTDLDQRTRVVLEILDTEQTYIAGITIAIENFLKPLREFAEKEQKFAKEDVDKIFGGDALEALLLINNKFCGVLEERIEQWETKDEIGDIFDQWAPRFKPYCRYGSNYEVGIQHLANMRSNNNKFRKVLEYYEDHSMKFNGLKLNDYLIMPVQRIPRYCLLLRDLLSKTPKEHNDHAALQSAMIKMEEMAKAVNEAIRQAEGQLKLRELIARGGGFENLFAKDRSFVKQGTVALLLDLSDRKKGSKRETELILCNDLVVAGNFVAKQRELAEYTLPVAILWVSTTPDDEVMKILESENLKNKVDGVMLLRGPERTWLVVANDAIDRASWLEAIAGLQHRKIENLPSGDRIGKYDFDFPVKRGTYDGEWLDGMIHGKGVYKRSDGTIFDGHWDHRFQAGYGTIISGDRQQESGWKYSLPNGDVEPALEEYGLWGSSNLTDRDWQLLLTGAREVQYKKGDKILEQGQPNFRLYRIKSGQCRVEKQTESGRVVLGTMGPKAMFGDTSVLPSMNVATASVVADSDVTEVYAIEVSILLQIFKSNPGLCVRFYKQMAIQLSQRLKNLHAPPAKGKKKKKEQKEKENTNKNDEGDKNKESDSADQSVCARFDLPTNEIVIKECEATLRAVMKKYGQLYVTRNYVCFEAQVFGMWTREVIPLSKVISVHTDPKKKELKIVMKGKKYSFGLDGAQLEELHSLIEKMVLNLANKSDQDDDSSDSQKTSTASNSASKRSTRTLNETGASLTKDDWQILQQGFKLITYTKDEPVVEQSVAHQRIYQIAKGRCRIEIKAEEGQKVVGVMNTGALFGEMSFLEGGAATASVIADEDAVDMYIIEGYFINIVFVKYPDLAGRFYCYIASVLAERLNAREAAIAKENKKKAKREKAAANAQQGK